MPSVERATYVVSGGIEVTGQMGNFGKDRLNVFKPGAEIVLRAVGATSLLLLGGGPLPGKRLHLLEPPPKPQAAN